MSLPEAPSSLSLDELAARHRQLFLERFGAGDAPRVFYAPGRVNLMGAHLDYNGGPVLPTAIDRGTLIAVRPRTDGRLAIASTHDRAAFEGRRSELPAERTGAWFDYPLGVLLALEARASRDAPGFEVLYGGNLPIGAGLSSSASICVGTACTLDSTWDLGLSPMERVQAALRAERGFVGVQCGIMDPYAVGLARPGCLLWLDCKDSTWSHLPLDSDAVSIAVADSGVRRELAASEFNRRVRECQEAFEVLARSLPEASCLRDVPLGVLAEHRAELAPELARRAEHVLSEVERTFDARDALAAGDLARFGELMSEAHRSLRDLYEVSCDELDALVDAACESEGCLGARLTGAGFGGCAVLLIERGAETSVIEHVGEHFDRRFGRRPPIERFGPDGGPRALDAD